MSKNPMADSRKVRSISLTNKGHIAVGIPRVYDDDDDVNRNVYDSNTSNINLDVYKTNFDPTDSRDNKLVENINKEINNKNISDDNATATKINMYPSDTYSFLSLYDPIKQPGKSEFLIFIFIDCFLVFFFNNTLFVFLNLFFQLKYSILLFWIHGVFLPICIFASVYYECA